MKLKSMLTMMHIGLPGGINSISFTLSQAVVTPLIAFFGTAVVAAYGVGIKVIHVSILISFGFGMGIAPLIGNLLGYGDIQRAWRTANQSIWINLGITSLLGSAIFILAPQIMSVFFKDAGIIEIGIELLRIQAIGLPFIGIWIISENIFLGAGDNVPPMIVSLVASWGVEIPLILLVTRILNYDQTSVWWVKVFYSAVGSLPLIWWLYRGKWIRKRI
ncbi:MAG: MATE family efflux transporter [bacterium]